MEVPNKVTAFRIILSLVLIPVLYLPGRIGNILGGVLFLGASLSDFLDGYIARSRGRETYLGEIMDPIADKILVASALIVLVDLGKAPGWVVALIVLREIFITGFRVVAAESGFEVKVSVLGKIKTFLQMAATFLLIVNCKFGVLILYLSLAFTLYSGFLYLRELCR